jgi:hypothetical protein
MFKFLKFIKNVALLNRRLNEEEERQNKEGYSIKFTQEGPEQYINYYEGNRKLAIGFEFTWLNDVILQTNSFIRWNVPKGQELTPDEYQKVLSRLIRYFSCWGGEVILDDSPFQWL